MGSKNHLFCIVLLFLVSVLGAQEYYLYRNDGETRFIQLFIWQAEEYAWSYEVLIEEKRTVEGKMIEVPDLEEEEVVEEAEVVEEEKEEKIEEEITEKETVIKGGEIEKELIKEEKPIEEKEEVIEEREEAIEVRKEYFVVVREFTDTAHVEVSLLPGIYRYRVTVYDLLNRPGETSEWIQFEVIEALQPEVQNFSPAFFHLEQDAPWILNLTGRNLSPDAHVYLHCSEINQFIVPLNYSSDASLSETRLEFDVKQLVPGSYDVYIINPGGLATSTGTFKIGFRKASDIYIGASYTPLLPVFGNLGQLANRPVFPLGATLRFDWVPVKKSYGHFGLELNAGWHYLSSGTGDNKVSFHILGMEVNVLFQKWLPNRIMAVNIRGGGGLATTKNMLLPQAEAGASFLWLFRKPFFMEAGIDYVHWFANDSDASGYLRPWLGAGIKF